MDIHSLARSTSLSSTEIASEIFELSKQASMKSPEQRALMPILADNRYDMSNDLICSIFDECKKLKTLDETMTLSALAHSSRPLDDDIINYCIENGDAQVIYFLSASDRQLSDRQLSDRQLSDEQMTRLLERLKKDSDTSFTPVSTQLDIPDELVVTRSFNNNRMVCHAGFVGDGGFVSKTPMESFLENYSRRLSEDKLDIMISTDIQRGYTAF